jgi:hypothetical protein
MSKPPAAADVRFDHIQAFLDKTRGQLTIGETPALLQQKCYRLG